MLRGARPTCGECGVQAHGGEVDADADGSFDNRAQILSRRSLGVTSSGLARDLVSGTASRRASISQ